MKISLLIILLVFEEYFSLSFPQITTRTTDHCIKELLDEEETKNHYKMKFPTIFVNHGGGPLPLMGRQPALVQQMKEITTTYLPSITNGQQKKPKAIVVVSAHWESDPIKVTSSPKPSMYYDYGGFPPETYKYKYDAPGSPHLASKIQRILQEDGLKCELDDSRGYDHGVFVPLMVMFPEADIPVVCVSLHSSLDAERNMKIGTSLSKLREEEEVLIIGSGYTFHNMQALMNPGDASREASKDFNIWLKNTIMDGDVNKLKDWQKAPYATLCHPRCEHLLPLFVVAAAAGDNNTPKVIFDTTESSSKNMHPVTGYMFQ